MFSACWDGSPKSATRLKTITAFMKFVGVDNMRITKVKAQIKIHEEDEDKED